MPTIHLPGNTSFDDLQSDVYCLYARIYIKRLHACILYIYLFWLKSKIYALVYDYIHTKYILVHILEIVATGEQPLTKVIGCKIHNCNPLPYQVSHKVV